MIANVIEPTTACARSGLRLRRHVRAERHFVERCTADPQRGVTFYGMEKNPTTIRLAKMNLAVHGLEGKIQKAISYYEDPHELLGKADFVMANPPFNVDEVDADKIKNDPRLPFGLPGVNKNGKVSQRQLPVDFLLLQLPERHGPRRLRHVLPGLQRRAREAEVRRKLVETGDVDVMIAIRGNFFYTRTVPCELWFFDKDKPKERRTRS